MSLLVRVLLLASLAAPGAEPAPPPEPTPAVEPAPAPPAVPTAAPQLSRDPLLERPPEPIVDSSGYLLFKTLMVLGVVVCVIYLTLNVGARKLLRLGPERGALVKVVDRVPLDAKKTLFVLEAGGEYLLVGASEGSMSLISKLETGAVQQALAARARPEAPGATFLERLNALRTSPPNPLPERGGGAAAVLSAPTFGSESPPPRSGRGPGGEVTPEPKKPQ